MKKIITQLLSLQDKKYRDFQIKLFPTVTPASVIGVRTPELRALAKKISHKEDICGFLECLPHKYFDENQLHAFIISDIKDFDVCIKEVERFLPFVDNWATCDQLSPKVFKKHKSELLVHIKQWLGSDKQYTVRFGIGMLLAHFLDDDFDISYLDMVAAVKSDQYYINMMIAWFFATALAKQYDSALPYLKNRRLDCWTHNKTIQKACESYRVPDEHKQYLKTLKIKDRRGKTDAV